MAEEIDLIPSAPDLLRRQGDISRSFPKTNSPLRGVAAGAITGMIEMSINFPTDFVKTQLQLDEKSVTRSSCRYTGPIDVVSKTVQAHGVRGLYRGLNVAIWNPKTAVRFGAFEQLKSLLADGNGNLSPHALLFCGFAAGICEAVLATTPTESIKVKFIHDQHSPVRRYTGLFQGIRQIIREYGIRGIYQGVVPTVMKSSTSQGTRFFVVESLKDWRKRSTGKPASKPLIALFGALGGAASVVLNSPFDAVKSRMQSLNSCKYRNTVDCFYRMWKQEGLLVFYRGWNNVFSVWIFLTITMIRNFLQTFSPERVDPTVLSPIPQKTSAKGSPSRSQLLKDRAQKVRQNKRAQHHTKALVAGTIAGVFEISLTYPIDYAKIQMQLDARSDKPRFCGMMDVYKQTFHAHGIKGLYRGWNVAVLSPKTVVRFQAFEFFKKLNLDSTGHLSAHGKLLCGLAAGAFEAALAVTPIESVKVKFIHDLNFPTQKYEGVFQGVRRILRKQGIRGIYAGLVPTVMKTSTNQAIRFFVVESLKDWRKQGNPKAKVSKPLTAVFGAIGGIVSVFCNTPLDVMKSRLQGIEAKKYRNIVHCAYLIASKEGFSGFYKGTMARLMRTPLETAITFMVYDLVMEILHEVWEP
ncbi:uncharacterized protein LOC129580727 [Paramacrobiotus metropolitanus]|uniref:uncharacterized protein LOC129580727 n=1 Tax=Paramacrobiotus metropolitanus TaxID=2943436 RepID=UPI0024456223|nr:uncharacterized protein LOC129580727 [Paramacrobiotus metropolitanus]